MPIKLLKNKLSVRGAAVLYNVSETTLRDRSLGTVHQDTVNQGLLHCLARLRK